MRVILKTLGTLDDGSLAFIMDSGCKDHVKNLSQGIPPPDASILNKLKCSDKLLVDLLKSMLEFNPYLRPSAKELLHHPVFDEIRGKIDFVCDFKLLIDIDKDEMYDAETTEFKMTKEELIDQIKTIISRNIN